MLSLLPNDSLIWLLGIMSSIYYSSAIGGNLFAKKCLDKICIDVQTFYVISRIALGASLLCMALQKNIWMFLLFYSLVYLSLGICNIPEGAILHSRISPENRASFLSLVSLIAHVGSLSSSAMSSVLIRRSSISGIWVMNASLILIMSLWMYEVLWKKQKGKIQ